MINIDGSQDVTGSDGGGGGIAANRPIQIGGEQYHSGAWFKGINGDGELWVGETTFEVLPGEEPQTGDPAPSK